VGISNPGEIQTDNSPNETFFEVGPAFRPSGNLNGANPSKYGATAGGGVEAKWGKVQLSPALRYTRWAIDQTATPTNRNQIEAIIGFSY